MTTTICTIGARGGSKGVPGKNTRLLAGIPLLAWSIKQARTSGLFDLIAVSSDSEDILRVAKEAGADHLVERPAEMATDEASKLPAILHCLLEAERVVGRKCDVFVDLAATSPLRAPEDIVDAVSLLHREGADNVLTAVVAKASPYFSQVEVAADGSVQLCKLLQERPARRQDAPPCYDLNGSIWVWRRHVFCDAPAILYPKTRLYMMPEERSVDIDSELDFRIAEMLAASLDS